MLKLTRYLIDSLSELEAKRAAVDEVMADHDPDDVWMTIGDKLDQEIIWRQEMFAQIIRGELPNY